ncbi:acyl transferase/acyl hydrolase/lysophospholipase [Cyathus striatus]|nr:acyl transferase/acyl hydrolase/lysophospholipase [Cyathus striatus]
MLLLDLALGSLSALLFFPHPVEAQGGIADYAPSVNLICPVDGGLIRTFTAQNQSLHQEELDYVHSRQIGVVKDAWNTWLGNGSQIQYDITSFEDNFPTLGIALSGGGYRAAQYGAGVLSALDMRNISSRDAGTGGLLQTASYISGLSGGSWLTGSLYANEWPAIPELVFGDGNSRQGWLLDLDLVTPDGVNIFSKDNQDFFGSLIGSVKAKAAAGFDTSITDPWSRPQDRTSLPMIQHMAPVSPLEFTSFDPGLSAAANLTFIGTNITGGRPMEEDKCVTGFDEIGFVLGTSSSLFSEILNRASNDLSVPDSMKLDPEMKMSQTGLSLTVRYPFQGISNTTFEDSEDPWLELVDGGLNGENIPLGPLMVKARNVDVIIAVDATSDNDDSWPE